MESHTQSRFSKTPPDSPKSCIKGSRRINFADQSADSSRESGSSSSSSPGPKRSTKTVVIKSPGTGSSTVEDGGNNEASPSATVSTSGPSSSSSVSVQKPPGEIQFQFHLSQHYEQSTPPPNCTSNGDSNHHMDNSPTSSNSTDNNEDLYKDPQLVEIASKFVNEIIEKAKLEAASRQKTAGGREGEEDENDSRQHPASIFRDFLTSRTPPWYRRAHGAFSKWITNLCVRAQNSMRT